jgi:hypothetical protein
MRGICMAFEELEGRAAGGRQVFRACCGRVAGKFEGFSQRII